MRPATNIRRNHPGKPTRAAQAVSVPASLGWNRAGRLPGAARLGLEAVAVVLVALLAAGSMF